MKKRKLLLVIAGILLVGITLSITVGYILLSSIPTTGFPLVQIRGEFVPDGGTYFVVYKDNQGRVFELGTTPRTRIFPLDLPLSLSADKSGPRVYPYFRRYLRFPKVIAAPCSPLEKELQQFLQLLGESSRPEDQEVVAVINRVIERNKQYCKD